MHDRGWRNGAQHRSQPRSAGWTASFSFKSRHSVHLQQYSTHLFFTRITMTATTMPQQPKRVAQPTAQLPMVAIRAPLDSACA